MCGTGKLSLSSETSTLLTYDRVTIGQTNDLASVKNVKVIEDTYAKQDFPQDASTTAFTSTSWYWRQRDLKLGVEDEQTKSVPEGSEPESSMPEASDPKASDPKASDAKASEPRKTLDLTCSAK